ncbi:MULTISPECIES: hypothetical protein [unclassified Paracoccus (in: a-proteobacteria)]|uniref:hypothetical protein n=1 Tax=unclassified Paracoccus (in: a-proteobacteria) TaxID=2688777 RepID=UPI0015FF3916|nr:MULTISPECIES: hypothetical protein [unclassified Paracoccus (in: a-proteobacteria)]MBB1492861.1 hypothetical protein [Paracoccus sp. MC1854]MBB1499281.1 hypothetical protein [Paracoccus sp. MC1862]QQO45821.1 hypothetical protein JGR78_05805 [Paracoccus sp. MC1862]
MQIDPLQITITHDGDVWTARYGTLTVSYRHQDNYGYYIGTLNEGQVREFAWEAFEVDLEAMTAHQRLELVAVLGATRVSDLLCMTDPVHAS